MKHDTTERSQNKSMKIAIYNNGIVFDGGTPANQPLGGSESSIVYMARELVRAGHTVSVYCNCTRPGLYEGVAYIHYHQFFSDHRASPWDSVIAFRSFDPMLLGRLAPRMIFWTGDADDQPCLEHFEHPVMQQNVDLVFCVSQWHRESFIRRFGLPAQKVIATRNGFSPELIPPAGPRDVFRSAYTSTPFRGLDILLDVFPTIRQQVPTATLDVFSSMKVYGWSDDRDREMYGALYKASEQPGVQWRGSVRQPDLMHHLSRTGLLLYPNTFNETSCIAAIEAQASGCVVITSARAALRETVVNGETGLCIEGEPRTTEYKKAFVEAAVGVLTNPDLFARLSTAARQRAERQYGWDTIAKEWTGVLGAMPIQSVSGRFTGPLSLLERAWGYARMGNLVAARRLAKEVENTPFFKRETAELQKQLPRPMASRVGGVAEATTQRAVVGLPQGAPETERPRRANVLQFSQSRRKSDSRGTSEPASDVGTLPVSPPRDKSSDELGWS
jgi:glycosyltransferase involved in cell wall biosynthesis